MLDGSTSAIERPGKRNKCLWNRRSWPHIHGIAIIDILPILCIRNLAGQLKIANCRCSVRAAQTLAILCESRCAGRTAILCIGKESVFYATKRIVAMQGIKCLTETDNGLSPTWTRRYQPPEEEVGLLQKLKGLDALAALLALTKEGAEIGDVRRFQIAKAAALQYLKIIDSDPACKRIYRQVRTHVSTDLENYTDVRRYSRTLHYGFGLPASWRALLTSPLIERSREELGLNAPSASASMS